LVSPVKRKRLVGWRSLLTNRFGEARFPAKSSLVTPPLLGLEARQQKRPFFAPLLFHKQPTVAAVAVFLLALSGPPRLRIRDPEASLRGDLDWVVILHLVVWGAAGLWVLAQIAKRFQAKRPWLRLRLPQILGLAMILGLAASAWVSDAPLLTVFKVYQILVSLLLTQIFAERFGAWTSLKTMLWGTALLCIAIAGCAFLLPDAVWTASEFNPEPSRLFGELIAPTGVVSVLAIILLLTCVRKVWKLLPLAALTLFIGLLALSLMRTAYVTAFAFFALVLLKRPNIKPLRRIAYVLCMSLMLLYVWGRLPSVGQYRDPESVSTLGDRVGLWRHLTAVTLHQSPWFGLGYYSASRIHGPEYNPGLGTAHSMFVEVLSGGGLASFALLTALCVTVSIYAVRLLYRRRDRLSFATAALFIACLLFGFTGEELDSGPVAIGFWFCVAVLPWLYEQSFKQVPAFFRPSPELTKHGLAPEPCPPRPAEAV
jgi:hypothetical protein